MALLSWLLLFTTSLHVSFISVFVYAYEAVKFISIIILSRRYYEHALCSLRAAGQDRVSAGWARGHELRARTRARLSKRGESAVSNLISLAVGSRRNKGMSGRRERRGEVVILQSTVGVLLYLNTHQQNYRFMRCKHTLAHCTHAVGKLSTCSSLCNRVAWVNAASL